MVDQMGDQTDTFSCFRIDHLSGKQQFSCPLTADELRQTTESRRITTESADNKKLAKFGAFCEIIPGTDGLCHVSEVTEGFVEKVEEYLKVGDVIPVKVINIDERGKVSLSIKQAKPGGLEKLPPDVVRDVVEDTPSRDRGRGGGRDHGRGRPRR